jgi:hypothetical protein
LRERAALKILRLGDGHAREQRQQQTCRNNAQPHDQWLQRANNVLGAAQNEVDATAQPKRL